ncbi:hypothetical protein SOVF_072460 [Spinacia oleracea]|nr:hypothetical protein SOVF_072460 [Spinacia oleracea]
MIESAVCREKRVEYRGWRRGGNAHQTASGFCVRSKAKKLQQPMEILGMT